MRQATLRDRLRYETGYDTLQATIRCRLRYETGYDTLQATIHCRLGYATAQAMWSAMLHYVLRVAVSIVSLPSTSTTTTSSSTTTSSTFHHTLLLLLLSSSTFHHHHLLLHHLHPHPRQSDQSGLASAPLMGLLMSRALTSSGDRAYHVHYRMRKRTVTRTTPCVERPFPWFVGTVTASAARLDGFNPSPIRQQKSDHNRPLLLLLVLLGAEAPGGAPGHGGDRQSLRRRPGRAPDTLAPDAPDPPDVPDVKPAQVLVLGVVALRQRYCLTGRPHITQHSPAP
ncbi:hypothetical protein CRUP_009261 [Coryphaenoides rupestris]|nr:hypothetical protein CRUP_009261 [Coryphaenoides rupestris]